MKLTLSLCLIVFVLLPLAFGFGWYVMGIAATPKVETDTHNRAAVEALAYMYGVAAMEHHLSTSAKTGCAMLKDADRIAGTIPEDFDREYVNTMAGMTELRKDCK